MKKIILLLSVFIATIYGESLRIELKDFSTQLANYQIIDAREASKYRQAHIKGARNFPMLQTFDDITTNGKIINPIKMQKIARSLGLDINKPTLIYDDGNFFEATRVFWVLEVYGFSNVKLLNGSFDDWAKHNYPIAKGSEQYQQSQYVVRVNNKKLATKFSTQIATHNKNQYIIDARDKIEYLGKKSLASRFGHIPNAISIPATHNLSKTDTTKLLKSKKELAHIYKDIDKNSKVIIYCSLGKISTVNYFALRELGYKVSNYDASWKEWGNDYNLPITNPSKK